MALDKQRILHELGSVMNQLQSADCGCMGKLFSNNGQGGGNMNSPLPTCGGCRRGCCNGHGYGNNYGTPSAGEPYSMNKPAMTQPCMGRCNPPKLYADTYGYLNENLMQPVVQDVYQDLKTITPANTFSNNPMASKMGLSPQANNMMGQNQMQGSAMENQNMNNMGNNMNSMPNNQQQMSQMAGMGPDILKMIMGDGSSKPSSQGHGGQLTQPMVIDAPQSPHGQVGVTPLTPPSSMNPGHYNMSNMGQASLGQEMQNPTTQYMQQPQRNMFGAQGSLVNNNMIQNPGTQQMGQAQMGQAQMGQAQMGQAQMGQPQMGQAQTRQAQMGQPQMNSAAQPMGANRSYGQHTQGITKFNEMFPGVMQGGDLGFDPMAIAIQMNPANQKKAAMDVMQKMMSGNSPTNSAMQPAIAGANAANAQLSPVQQNLTPNNQMMSVPPQSDPIQQQQDGTNAATASKPGHVSQQQVYTALSGAPMMNEQPPQQQIQNQQYQQAKQMIDPNTGAPTSNLPTVYEDTANQPPAYSTPQSEAPEQPMIKDPIFPADTSKNMPSNLMRQQKYYQYNTLGQPIEMLPASRYHIPEPNLPQTLSPQPNQSRTDKFYSNVKATVSKTSLTGNRPVGRIPSKGQLQQIYNQYKGSQSFTHQNIKAPDQVGTYSQGRLNVTQGNQQVRQAPIEKVGGDTANNQILNSQVENIVETVVGQKGDVPAATKPREETKVNPTMQSRCRNGLQDMTYTSYPTTAAWSFHGDGPTYPTSYSYRNRV